MTLKELGRKYRFASQTGEMGPYSRNKKTLERYLQVNDKSHAKFKTLLKYKMDCVGGRVVEYEYEYTSKTCSSCGGIKNDLGGSSTYKCSFCHVVYDRDANVAKSIFHKNVQMPV
ncbi:hypothetical protein BBO99_00001438 [Phytophthora kernoviae]|nr:hypothetical protein G195_002144 [Phytophthora kernoviae 00238/432]RLN26132.1 hypothetical protein BBI17_001307 [Phytophthora kernoviae]RLN84317.1 hypothetical protein BBO99_00001438 [Phytophthora kernoviae]